MPILSFLEPDFELQMYREFLDTLPELMAHKTSLVTESWKKAERELLNETNEEYKEFVIEGYQNDYFYIEQFEHNILFGILVSIYSTFEDHLKWVLMGISNMQVDYVYPENERTIKLFDELKKSLKCFEHPNKHLIDTIFNDIVYFNKIRNYFVHSKHIPTQDLLDYALDKQPLIKIGQNNRLELTEDYLTFVIDVISKFFKLLIYKDRKILIKHPISGMA